MTKTDIANGMSFVEIPEAGLGVLCGCPENSVKFMMRRGVIREVEKDGTRYETGPNAILLSELPVQGGRFRNLGEFPVLQMLYRQGMIVPGHPGNTGQRPMIIGMRDQVEAQSRYIYSGNYGLASVEELTSAGLGREAAAELFRMKLNFAFGSIRKSEELLDLRVIDGRAIALRGGAFLRRIETNRYEFSRGAEAVQVSLDPPPLHELPYELPRREARRSYFSILHIGEGDGWDPERPCMASIVVFRGEYYLIDAGPDIEASLEALGIGIDDLRGVFLTHAHDDHFVGLTALLRAERRLRLFAAPWVRASVEAKLRAIAGIGEREFRMYFEQRDLEVGAWNDLGGLEVLPTMSPHPVETTVLRFKASLGGVSRSYAHLADLASFSVLDSMVVAGGTLPGISSELAARTKAAYLEAADLKKVDAGGGMIHGSASDFDGDESGRILMSHNLAASPLTLGPRMSVAAFGDADELLAGEAEGAAAPEAGPRAEGEGAPDELVGVAAFLRLHQPFSRVGAALLTELASTARLARLGEGEGLGEALGPAIAVVLRGRARVLAGGKGVGTIGPGDVFGEEGLIAQGRYFEALAAEPLEAYAIPYAALEKRPILLWKLREILERRLAESKGAFDFAWLPAYSVGEPRLDAQHRELFALIARLDQAIRSPESCPDSGALVAELADFAEGHFRSEEALMREGGYPELAAHSREHEALARDVAGYRRRLDCGDPEALVDLDGFLKDWALKHTLQVDRQYIPYLPA